VRDALRLAGAIPEPGRVTVHGELVHNPEVIRRLGEAGFQQAGEADRGAMPPTPLVLITAHGISDVQRRRLAAAGKTLIDATCPLVRRVHEAAQELAGEGRHVLVVGRAGHVEVRGIVEDLASYDVVGGVEEVRRYPGERLGIVSQTTMPPDVLRAVCERVRALNPGADIRVLDTVCLPTKQRQWAMAELLERVEAVVVVGGRHSNNTRRLVEMCEARGMPALHVERAEELEAAWFAGIEVVGLTAGTSTLDETIDAVERALVRIGASRREGGTEAAPGIAAGPRAGHGDGRNAVGGARCGRE
jgi:4-hydroxy-3-methylbut-2-enyl diphosphate reductase